MKKDFRHKVVVVVGAAGGIGRALSWQFAQAGARIVLIDLDADKLAALQHQVERSGTDVLSFVCDITDFDRCQAVMQEVAAQLGGIDVLINNAGISHRSHFAQTQMTVLRRVMEVNYFGAIHCTRAALNSLIDRRGLVITLSSTLGLTPAPGLSGYSASKYALHGLFESLRQELKAQGVDVLMACPGTTDTDFHKKALSGDGSNIESPREMAQRMNSPQEVAENIFNAAQRGQQLVVMSRPYRGIRGWLAQKIWPALFASRAFRRWRSEIGS